MTLNAMLLDSNTILVYCLLMTLITCRIFQAAEARKVSKDYLKS